MRYIGSRLVVVGICVAIMWTAGSHDVGAQGTISTGIANWTVSASHFDGTPEVEFTGVNPTPLVDHVNHAGWWYRVSGDATESFMPTPDLQSYVAHSATLNWIDVNGRGFDATEVQTITNVGNGIRVLLTMRILNSSGAPITIDLFHALDLDLDGTAGGDAGTLAVANSEVTVSDAGTSITARYRGYGATNYAVRTADGSTDTVAMLNDGDLDDYDNTGLPFAAGDLTMGFQWVGIVIPNGVQTQVQAELTLTRPVVPPVPDPITIGYIPNNSSGRGSAFFSNVAPPPGTTNHRIRVRDEAGNAIYSTFVLYPGGVGKATVNFDLPLADAHPKSWETGIQVIINARNAGLSLDQHSFSYVGHASSDMTDFDFDAPVLQTDPPGLYGSTLTDDRPTGATSHYTYDITRRVFNPLSTTLVGKTTHGISGPFGIKKDHPSTPIVMSLPVVFGQQMFWVRPRQSFKNSAGGNLGRYDIAPKSPNINTHVTGTP